jgi:NADH:ubiquinone reductase (H+-translocating)
MQNRTRPRVIVIGAGFGGLYTARSLANKEVDVLLVDRNNFHLFTPLLYQVATAGLDPSQIAYPVRRIFRNMRNVRFRLGEVTDINTDDKTLTIKENEVLHTESYDYLVIAAGSTNNFFGNEKVERYAFGMKDLSEAITLRNHILRLFEKAAWVESEAERRALTTIVVVGGGPTGLETAGAIYELYNFVLKAEYRHMQNMDAKVILIEALPHLLTPYPENLRNAALKQLQSLGVEVMLNSKVKDVDEFHVELENGQIIKTHTLIWSAGVKGSPIADMLGVELQRGGRIPIDPTTEVIGRPNVFAIGDIAYLVNPRDDLPYPQVSPVAIQQGKLAAANILRKIAGNPMLPFHYNDRGIMATIGRRRAVAWLFYKIQLTGFIGWLSWLVLHLVWLLGFRNRVQVFVNWMWNYLTYDRSVRILIHEKKRIPEAAQKREIPLEESEKQPVR